MRIGRGAVIAKSMILVASSVMMFVLMPTYAHAEPVQMTDPEMMGLVGGGVLSCCCPTGGGCDYVPCHAGCDCAYAVGWPTPITITRKECQCSCIEGEAKNCIYMQGGCASGLVIDACADCFNNECAHDGSGGIVGYDSCSGAAC
jgi:hypothetical protein